MDEAPQRAAEASGGGTPLDDRPIVERARIGAGTAGQHVVHPHPMCSAVDVARGAVMCRIGIVDRGARHAAGCGDDEIGIDPSRMADGEHLHVERVGRLGLVRHLHHGHSCVVVAQQHERLVALAAHVEGAGGIDPEPLGSDACGLVDRPSRRR